MTIQSMTGFAQANCDIGKRIIQMEARSVNGKGVDFRFRLPAGFEALEAQLRALAGKKIHRGTVQFSLSLQCRTDAAQFRINEDYLNTLVKIAKRLENEHGLTPASVDGLLALNGVLDTVQAGADDFNEETVDVILATFSTLLDELCSIRAGEGERLKQIICHQIDEIERLANVARNDPARTQEAIQQRLMRQLEPLLNGALDPDRLYLEAALLATKADIEEEVDRLDAHIAAARDLLQSGGAIGRKFDFLAQEFNREANTLCSKANVVSLSVTGLALKNVIDQLREQVQNIV